MDATATIKQPHVFLDPDTGFYDRHTGESTKTVLVGELVTMLSTREAVIVYRHQYWPKTKNAPREVCPYVWHGLRMLWKAGLYSFAYQSQAASFFFVSRASQVWNRSKPASDMRWLDCRQPLSIDASCSTVQITPNQLCGADKGKDRDYYRIVYGEPLTLRVT